MERLSFENSNNDSSEQNRLSSELLDFWSARGYTPRTNGFPLLSCPKSLLVVNSTIAPYIDNIIPNSKVDINDVLVQKCVRMNALNKSGLLISNEWNTSFVMGGIVTSESTLTEVTKDTFLFFTDKQGIDTDKLVISLNPNDVQSIEALKQIKIDKKNVDFLDKNKDVWVNWQFGTPGPNGDGITFSLIMDEDRKDIRQFLNIIHIDKYLDKDGVMQTIPSQVIDMGFGLERFISLRNKTGLYGSNRYREYIESIKTRVKNINPENTKRIMSASDNIETLKIILDEGINPGNKNEKYVARKLARNIFLQLDLLECFENNNLYETIFNKEEREILDSEVVAYRKIVQTAEKVIKKIKPNQFCSRSDLVFLLKDTYGIPEEIAAEFVKVRV